MANYIIIFCAMIAVMVLYIKYLQAIINRQDVKLQDQDNKISKMQFTLSNLSERGRIDEDNQRISGSDIINSMQKSGDFRD